MTTSRKQVLIDRGFPTSYDPSIRGKVLSTVEKIMRDSTTNGLHIEPVQNCADERVRTARVDQFHRMVLFDLKDLWLAYGVYAHDRAYAVAAKAYARVNPLTGDAEIRQTVPIPGHDEKVYSDSELKALVEERAAQLMARQQNEAASASSAETIEITDPNPLSIFESDVLAGQLGVDEPVAEMAVDVSTEEELVAFLERVGGWQADALLELATGTPLEEVRARHTALENGPIGGTAVGVPSETDDVVRAVTSSQGASRFHLIEDDAALEKALSNGDFEAWRLFLHPDQQEYVEKKTSGPFRLSGGAGTGKTVVLVHRAARLARQNPGANVLVVSYTRNLVEMIAQQIRALDPALQVGVKLGAPGVSVMTLDQVARTVLNQSNGSPALLQGMEEVLGWGVRRVPEPRNAGIYGMGPWEEAIDAAGSELPEELSVPAFLRSEYQEVILPAGITTEKDYLRAPRVGRGTRLGRNQRRAVWAVVQRYRDSGLTSQQIDWDEAAAVAAAVLTKLDSALRVDHLLIDEGQDFTPTRWVLARAIVPESPDDLFIAEDSNQRIYGQRVVLGHYGIKVVGRSRRLRLNYRTTAQNLSLALRVLDGGDYDLDEAEDQQIDHSRERYLSSRSGPAPLKIPTDDLVQEYDRVAEVLRTWIREVESAGLAVNTIGILTRTKKQRDALVRALGERGVSVAPVDQQDIPTGTPAAMTLHRAKGTEFSRVLLFEVSETSIPRFFRGSDYDEKARADNALRERSLLYVGATRARDMLAISWSKEASPYLPEAVV